MWSKCFKLSLIIACKWVFVPACFAHELSPQQRETWWFAWNFDFWLILQFSLLAIAYHHGANRLRRVLRRRQVYSFWAALFFLIMALLSPMDALSQELSFVHMIQHLLLMMVAAPLLVMSMPVTVILASLSARWRRRYWQALRKLNHRHWLSSVFWQAAVIWGLNALILWIWHIPLFYIAALRFAWVHYVQHLSFFLVSCLFWRIVFDPISQRRMNHALGILYLFTSSLHAAVLGVFMSLAPSVWYFDYTATAPRWGWSALEDQQLAGLIMWMPACAFYALGASVLLLRALEKPSVFPSKLRR
ncbi:MAG: cytochrome c oxidase assembly protein [Oligoflexus sp.]